MEFAVGTGLTDQDTDNDGLSDYVEIMQGLDPLGGKGLPTGIVAAAALSGQAMDVTVEGSLTDPNVQTAFVATGPHGLAILDVSQSDKPILLSEFNLPGFNFDVAVDLGRNLAVMAAGESGLHLIDITDFSAPMFIDTIPVMGSASQLELSGGIAYVAVGSSVVSIDVDSQAILQTLSLDQTITDIGLDGTTLFILDNNSTLTAISLVSSTMTLRGSLQVLITKGRFAVGDGIAYVPAKRGQPPSDGFVTIDVSDPTNLVLIGESTRPPTNLGSDKNDFVVTGSGLGLKFDEMILGPGLPVVNALNLFVIANPLETNEFVTQIVLPDLSQGLTIGAGFAFVADNFSDLQIVNFQPIDTLGLVPVVNASTKEADRDPVTSGIQVRPGARIRVDAKVLDDVLVRNVELLVNGQVVRNDASFPWDLVATTPPVSNQPITLMIQVRATDTGGNTGLSNLLIVDVIPDLVAPALMGTVPNNGQTVPRVDEIDLLFDEALDTNLLVATGVELTHLGANNLPGGGDDTIIAISQLILRDQDRTLRLLPTAQLNTGTYTLLVNASILADIAGNHVLAPVQLSFTIPAGNRLVAARGIAADPTLPSANTGQEFSFEMPWASELAKTEIVLQSQDTRIVNNQVIENAGDHYSEPIAPRRSDPLTETAYFLVAANAITSEAAVFGGGYAYVTDLPNWTVINGELELFGQDANGNNFQNELPGNGLYVELGGNGSSTTSTLESKALFQLTPGEYELRFDLAGARFSIATESVVVSLGNIFNESFSRPALSLFSPVTRVITVTEPISARLLFDQVSSASRGIHLDNVRLTRVDSGAILIDDQFDLPFVEGNFLLQIVPTLDKVDVISISNNGTTQSALVEFRGSGFIEGENTAYRFGNTTVVDTSFTAGPDVTKNVRLGTGCLFMKSPSRSGGSGPAFSQDSTMRVRRSRAVAWKYGGREGGG